VPEIQELAGQDTVPLPVGFDQPLELNDLRAPRLALSEARKIPLDQLAENVAVLHLAEHVLDPFEHVYDHLEPVGIEVAQAFSGISQSFSGDPQSVKLLRRRISLVRPDVGKILLEPRAHNQLSRLRQWHARFEALDLKWFRHLP